MEKYYLEIPTIERKEEALVYVKEFYKYNSNPNGVGDLDKFIENNRSYEEWLTEIENYRDKSYAEERNRVPATTYFTIRESDNKIVGMVNFRHYLNDALLRVGGHIGYGIRPTERRKGLAKIQLFLTILEAQKMGIDKVMLDCVDTNIGSKKTIKSLGGEFSETVEAKEKTYLNFWINVDECIEKYMPTYEKYIEEDKKVK